MATRITVYIIDPGDKKIHVAHEFYGHNLAEAQRMKTHHLAACEYFRAAETAGETAEEVDEIDQTDWPTYEVDTGYDGDVLDMEEE